MNKWQETVKRVAKQHPGKSLREILPLAKAEYKKMGHVVTKVRKTRKGRKGHRGRKSMKGGSCGSTCSGGSGGSTSSGGYNQDNITPTVGGDIQPYNLDEYANNVLHGGSKKRRRGSKKRRSGYKRK